MFVHLYRDFFSLFFSSASIGQAAILFIRPQDDMISNIANPSAISSCISSVGMDMSSRNGDYWMGIKTNYEWLVVGACIYERGRRVLMVYILHKTRLN